MGKPTQDGQPSIHNHEAWELTRWLEEGVFGRNSCDWITIRGIGKTISPGTCICHLRQSYPQGTIQTTGNLFL